MSLLGSAEQCLLARVSHMVCGCACLVVQQVCHEVSGRVEGQESLLCVVEQALQGCLVNTLWLT